MSTKQHVDIEFRVLDWDRRSNTTRAVILNGHELVIPSETRWLAVSSEGLATAFRRKPSYRGYPVIDFWVGQDVNDGTYLCRVPRWTSGAQLLPCKTPTAPDSETPPIEQLIAALHSGAVDAASLFKAPKELAVGDVVMYRGQPDVVVRIVSTTDGPVYALGSSCWHSASELAFIRRFAK